MMESEFIIQKAEERDIHYLSVFACRTFADTFRGTCSDSDLENFLNSTYAPEILLKEWKDPLSEVWLIKRKEELAGYIKLNFHAVLPKPQTGTGMEIQRLYIDKKFFGQGLGKKLMQFAEGYARKLGEDVLWLGVWEFNEKAKNFYEKLGFQYFGSHPFPIGNTPQVDLWMIKKLIPMV
jgi:ribosomal protein S18 acetylase RimI-like enzyme